MPGFVLLHQAHGLDAVEHGHADVQEHDVGQVGPHPVQRLLAVLHHLDLDAQVRQHGRQDLAILGHVIGHQGLHGMAGRQTQDPIPGGRAGAIDRSPGSRQMHREDEARPLARLRLHLDGTAHEPQGALGNGQTEPGASLPQPRLSLLERLEEPLLLLLGHAGAGVGDLEPVAVGPQGLQP